MLRQTLKETIQWIVVDDGEKAIKILPPVVNTFNYHYVRPEKLWRPGINTQRLNLDLALPLVTGDKIFFIEDDDYYAPNYLEFYSHLLNHFNVVGETNAKYYNLKYQCYKEMGNYKHSSLCQTAITKKALPLMDEAINSGELYIDTVFWEKVKRKNLSHLLFYDANLSIGIKGMPGREGIGIGHTPKGFISDTQLSKLKMWIGAEAKAYEPFIPRAIMPAKLSTTTPTTKSKS